MRTPTAKLTPRRRGAALIAVMWVVIVAGLILLGVNTELRVHSAMAHSELASVQAHWLARAGLEQALAILEDDEAGVDSMSEEWYASALLLKDVELGGGTFSVVGSHLDEQRPAEPRFGLIDHGGRANLNLVGEKHLAALADLSESQVAAILDWRDADDDLRSGGAEAGHYGYLRYPYKIRNGPFRTSRELLLVRGIDRQAYLGEDVNENGLLDPREDDGSSTWPTDNADGRLTVGLAGLTTVYSYERNRNALGAARINLNKADQRTLTEELGLSERLAKAIADRQKSGKFSRVMDLVGMKGASGSGPQAGGPPPDEAAKADDKVNEITLKWLAERLDELTVSDEERLPGRVNVNTAPRAVLMALPEMTDAAADAILRRRDSAEGPFGSVGELLTANVVGENQFKAIAELVTVRSNVFEVRSTGTTWQGIRKMLVAVVDRGAEPMTILYWYQGE